MVDERILQDEKIIIGGLYIALIFIFIAISQDIGILYVILIGAYTSAFAIDKQKVMQFVNGRIKVNYIMNAIILSALLLILSGAFTTVLTGKLFSVTAFFDILQPFSIFITTNSLLQSFVFGFLIPAVETAGIIIFVVWFLMNAFKTQLSQLPNTWQGILQNRDALVISVLTGLVGSLFHSKARIICTTCMADPTTALLIDWFFFSFSTMIALRYKQAIEALIVHIIVNVLYLLNALGILGSIGAFK